MNRAEKFLILNQLLARSSLDDLQEIQKEISKEILRRLQVEQDR